MSNYDSTKATLVHIKSVNANMIDFCTEILSRAKVHDNSKLSGIEKELNDKYSQELYSHEYNSEGYKDVLAKMKPAVDNHQENNSHHPEHYPNGIKDMNLFDLVEMYCDWKAASMRIPGNTLLGSLPKNKERYNISDELYSILHNTAIADELSKVKYLK